MSEINISITSEILPPLHCSTFKITSGNASIAEKKNSTSSDAINNKKRNIEVSAPTMNSLINPKHHSVNTAETKDESKNKLLKLKINSNREYRNEHLLNIVNNFQRQPEHGREITTAARMNDSSNRTPPKPKPIMGRNALLRKVNTERNDSLIIQELIASKYNDVLNHYYNRMNQRRRSKVESSEDEYSDTIFSSPPNWSPVSASSVETPNSLTLDDRNRFDFLRDTKEKRDLGFLKSTDDTNIDTTVEDLMDSSSLSSSVVSNDKSTTSYSEYDPKKFLENAIGEVTNVSSESGIDNNEPERKETNQKPEDYSVGPSDISSLLSRASGLYSSFKKSMRRNSTTQREEPQNEEYEIQETHQSSGSDNSLLGNLMRELSVQNEILFQVSKAINYLKTMKGFETTVEFIEAEKILLVASCTKAALTKEIENIDDDSYEKQDDPRSCGQIQLNNFKIYPKDGCKSNTHKELTEQFVLVLTCGTTVLASDVVFADENGMVLIEKKFEFKELATDFEILVYIYAIRVRHKAHQHQEHSNCPSPKKFFLNKVSKKYKVTNESLYIKPSSFLLWGKCEIRSPDLSKIKTPDNTSSSISLKMYNIPLNSSLSGMFSVKISSSVKLNNKMSGFLTIGLDNEHGCTIWNRRWCVLEGSTMRYWNYPSEEVTSSLGSIDLHFSLEQQISTVDRSLCARPRTLLVPVRVKDSEKNYLLSADNAADMKQWERELNYVIRVLSLWKCGGGLC